MDIKDKLSIIHQMCLGLDYAHRNSIYHRDVKPANIKVLNDGTVKIMDFGLATMQTSGLTKTGTIMGTPHYMSPEMVQGTKVDGRSDQFAVGVIFYEFLTYKRPFTGDNISTILYQILNEEPKSFQSNLTTQYPELQRIIERAIQKKPERRYQTIKQMANDIDGLRQKIITKGFHMTEPTVVIDETMDTVLMETELDYTSIAKKERKSKLPLYSEVIAILLVTIVALLYFLVF
jgi:serine/threonine protein kinase